MYNQVCTVKNNLYDRYKGETHTQPQKTSSTSNKLIRCHRSLTNYLGVVRVLEKNLEKGFSVVSAMQFFTFSSARFCFPYIWTTLMNFSKSSLSLNCSLSIFISSVQRFLVKYRQKSSPYSF